MFGRYAMVFAVAMLLAAGPYGAVGAQTGDDLIPIYEAGVEVWNNHDVELVSTYWTDDIVGDYVPFALITEGKDANIAFTLSFYDAFPDIEWITQRVLASGNILAIEWLAAGANEGEFLGNPPTGKGGATPHLTIQEYEGGKIKRVTHYLDYITVFVQIGLMPPPPELPPLTPSFALPDPEPSGLAPVPAEAEAMSRWNAHDAAALAKIIHADAEIFMATLGATIDRATYIAFTETYFQGFTDIQVETIRQLDMGDGWVLTEAVWRGTNDGLHPLLGVNATGRPVELRGGYISRYNADGLMTNLRAYMDNQTLFMQLGLIPAPEPSLVSRSTWGEIKSKFR